MNQQLSINEIKGESVKILDKFSTQPVNSMSLP